MRGAIPTPTPRRTKHDWMAQSEAKVHCATVQKVSQRNNCWGMPYESTRMINPLLAVDDVITMHPRYTMYPATLN